MFFPARCLFAVSLLPLVVAAGSATPREIPPDLERTLFRNADSRAAFDAAVAEAEKLGVPDAKLIEAQIISGIREDDVELCALGLYRAAKPGLVPDDRLRFFLGLARGYLAGREHRFADAEREFKDAFWLAPQLGDMVRDASSYSRAMQRMATIRVDLDRRYTLAPGGDTTLRTLLHGKKALLLDFWASWCGPCIRGLPALKTRENEIATKGIAVAGMNTEADAAKAEATRQKQGIEFPWLVDAAGGPLAEQLLIDTIPRAVLLSPEGAVLFNGDPSSPVLDAALAKLTAPPPDAGTKLTVTTISARANIEAALARLDRTTDVPTRLTLWRDLRRQVDEWSSAVLRQPTAYADADAISVLKLKTYFDLLPSEPIAAQAAKAVRNTLLVSASPWADPHTAADLSPEAMLALRALAAWCGDRSIAELSTR